MMEHQEPLDSGENPARLAVRGAIFPPTFASSAAARVALTNGSMETRLPSRPVSNAEQHYLWKKASALPATPGPI
jgi:hypothetical protein